MGGREDGGGRKRAGVVLLTAALLVAGAVTVVLANRQTSANRPAPGQARTDNARLSFQGFGSRDRVFLGSFRGRPLVVNYWASWCLFCAVEMPEFQKVYELVKNRVAFLGVDIKDDHGPAADLARQTGVRYPLAVDPDGKVFQRLRGVAMPTTFFFDETGRVVQRFSGPLTADGLRSQIRKHFGI